MNLHEFRALLSEFALALGKDQMITVPSGIVLTEEQKRTLAIVRIASACGVKLSSALAKLPDSAVLNYIADCVERKVDGT